MGLSTNNPLLSRGQDVGGTRRRSHSTDALVPTWRPGHWEQGKLVKEEVPSGSGKWVMYLAVASTSGTVAPSTGSPDWVALTPSPTAIPTWQPHVTYQAGQPVRIDVGEGLMRVFLPDRPIPQSVNSPDSAAGISEGWREFSPQLPPPPPPAAEFDPDVDYPLGALCQHPLGTLWLATAESPAGFPEPGEENAVWKKVA